MKGAGRGVCGSAVAVLAAGAQALVRQASNPAFIGRHTGTARKGRQRSCVSKSWDIPAVLTYFTLDSSNFCWPVRTRRVREAARHWRPRTPAMAAGLSDHIWPLSEWLTFPGVQRK